MDIELHVGDNMESLDLLPDNSVDSVVTDPPYGISFMAKKWDYDVPTVELWREVLRVLKPGGHALIACGTRTQHRMVVNIEDAGFEIRDVVSWVYGSGFPKSHNISKAIDKAAPETPEAAKQWDGWGTALKPACEFFTLCRKPLSEKTIAANVLKWGTGGINVDGCRVGTENTGRFPANLIHDGSEEVVGLFPQTKASKASPRNNKPSENVAMSGANLGHISHGHDDNGGSAARFFYCPKASKKDREEGNNHPTVKPTALMQYLCRMITPIGGVVLDPFMGSGSTGKAAKMEGFGFIGMELQQEYYEISKARIDAAEAVVDIDDQQQLF